MREQTSVRTIVASSHPKELMTFARTNTLNVTAIQQSTSKVMAIPSMRSGFDPKLANDGNAELLIAFYFFVRSNDGTELFSAAFWPGNPGQDSESVERLPDPWVCAVWQR